MDQQAQQTQVEAVRRVTLPSHLRIICRGAKEAENGGWDVFGTSPDGEALDPLEGLTFEEINEALLDGFTPFLGEYGESTVQIDGRRYGFRIFSRQTPRGNTISEMEVDGYVDKVDPETGEVTRWYVTLTDRAFKAYVAKRDQMPAAPKRFATAPTGYSVIDALKGAKKPVAATVADDEPKF